jgi:Ca-activated chloride channel family protein
MLSWDRPLVLIALLLLLPLGGLMLRAIARLRLRRARFAESPALDRMAVTHNEGEILGRMSLITLALALGILALAGPRWGASLGSLMPGESPSLVIALDVSQSMLADDLDGGRIERARAVMTEVVEGLPGWRVGLVAFADEAQVFCPLTMDSRALITLAQRARPGAELKGGSNLEVALAKSQELLGARPGAILMLTDGEQLAGDASRALRSIKEAGTLLIAVGTGTERGAKIRSGTDLFGQPIFRTYRGELVISRLDERGLSSLAREAGGHYLNSDAPGTAQRTLQLLNERWGGAQTGEAGVPLTALALLPCLVLLIADTAYSARRRLAGMNFGRVLNDVLKRSGHLVALLALTQIAWTWPWQGALSGAAASYEKGDFPAAVTQLEQALASKPDDPRLLYDLGCSLYQSGDFPGAAIAFKKALDRLPTDSNLRPWAHYNLGNALFRQSEQAKSGKKLLEEAAKAYEATLEIAPEDEDARHNLEVVKARLSDDPGSAKSDPSQGGNSSGSGSVPDLPAPDEAEIDATLDALEHDERQRQSEATEASPQSPLSPRDLMRQLMRQSPELQPDRKDW